ncbi:hypothetical protein BT63DRAFT_428157 [Microthyrium microscopicum]|uniref:Uncharacterized protein n=1 Tax=Microthyrium microscopicum TaxID=703497 RepID=A0A6A6U4L1_9PEZI|nr:hypothetical protein BT63DRAFT_428157 [Microthyrium microscopicum]
MSAHAVLFDCSWFSCSSVEAQSNSQPQDDVLLVTVTKNPYDQIYGMAMAVGLSHVVLFDFSSKGGPLPLALTLNRKLISTVN